MGNDLSVAGAQVHQLDPDRIDAGRIGAALVAGGAQVDGGATRGRRPVPRSDHHRQGEVDAPAHDGQALTGRGAGVEEMGVSDERVEVDRDWSKAETLDRQG